MTGSRGRQLPVAGPVDARGGRVVLLSHCLLNENVRYAGGATRSGAVAEVVQPLLRDGIGLCQMRCPEQQAWGGVRKRHMLRLYGRRPLRWRVIRRPVVALARAWTRFVYRRLARQVAREVADYAAAGFEVTGIVGVSASPSCGVTTTLDLDGAVASMAACPLASTDAARVNRDVVMANAVPGSGLFMASLEVALRRRHLDVRFSEHDLVAELRDAGVVGDVTSAPADAKSS